jgi:hypothetical protein
MTSADKVEIEGRWLPVRRTRKQDLRTVSFTVGQRQYAAIEQNLVARQNRISCEK